MPSMAASGSSSQQAA
jgi:small-conductance mechanosensitive channel